MATAVDTWSVKDLKKYLEERGIGYADCPEKPDLVRRVQECMAAEADWKERQAAALVTQQRDQRLRMPADVESALKQAFSPEQLELVVAMIRNQIIPAVIQQIAAFHLPPMHETSPDYDYGAEGVAVEDLKVAPADIDVGVQGNAIRLQIKKFAAKLREFDWHYARKNKFPRVKDSGRAYAKIKGGSIDVLLNVTLLPFAIEVAECDVKMNKLVLKTSGTKASFVYNMVLSIVSPALKKQVCVQLAKVLRDTIGQMTAAFQTTAR